MECCVEPVYKVPSKSMITRTWNISKTIHCQFLPLCLFLTFWDFRCCPGFPLWNSLLIQDQAEGRGELSASQPGLTQGSGTESGSYHFPLIHLLPENFHEISHRWIFSGKWGLESHKQQNMMVHAQDLELWRQKWEDQKFQGQPWQACAPWDTVSESKQNRSWEYEKEVREEGKSNWVKQK